jgi:hypothetical protein
MAKPIQVPRPQLNIFAVDDERNISSGLKDTMIVLGEFFAALL